MLCGQLVDSWWSGLSNVSLGWCCGGWCHQCAPESVVFFHGEGVGLLSILVMEFHAFRAKKCSDLLEFYNAFVVTHELVKRNDCAGTLLD
jgi:hypothetical protein